MASVTETAIASTTTDGSSATFAAQAIGANGGNDVIYIGGGARTVVNAASMSCTVDGVAADQIVYRSFEEGGNVRSNCGLFAINRNDLPDPSQTDVDVVLNHSNTCIRHAVSVAVSADATKTAHATAGQTNTSADLSLNTPSGGIVVGIAYNGDNTSWTWVGLTEVSDIAVAGEANTFSTAYASNVSAETPRTITATTGNEFSAKVAASFPAAASSGGRKPGGGLSHSVLLRPRRLVN